MQQKNRRRGTVAYRVIKRVLDILLSLFLSVLFLPITLFITLLVCIRGRGTPFYWQTRVGMDGRPIRILKFRTMCKNADDMLTPDQLALYRLEYKLTDDPRLIGYRKAGDGTRCFGAVLRRTSMDELPQLWFNVLLCGNMSLVGPRPVLKEELEQYYTKEERHRFLSAKPGVTGYWQAYARNNACYKNRERQKMELFYVGRPSLWFDLKILLKTVCAVFTKAGAK